MSMDTISIDPQYSQQAQEKKEAVLLVHDITNMLESGDFDWASDTLSGIADTIKTTGRVTEKQRQSVYNIEDARRHDISDWR